LVMPDSCPRAAAEKTNSQRQPTLIHEDECLELALLDPQLRLVNSSVFPHEPEFISVRVSDRELARAVRRVDEGLDHFGSVTKFRPPGIYITDAEVVSARSGDGFHLRERELSRAGLEMSVLRCRRPVTLRGESEDRFIPGNSPVKVADIDAHMLQSRQVHEPEI